MEQIFDSLKSLIDPLVGKAADTLGENANKVSGASKSILAGLLGQLASGGTNQQVENVIHDAANANIVSHLGAVFGTKGEVEQAGIGNKLVQALFGSKSQDFTDAIASESGISKGCSSQLTGMVGTAVAGFLGDKVKNGGFKLSDLLSAIGSQKSSFMKWIPAGLTGLIGGLGLNAAKTTHAAYKNKDNRKKGGMGWLLWLLLAIALLLLIIFGWRSCRNRGILETGERVVAGTEQAVETTADAVQNAVKKLTELVLPDGVRIEGNENGMESKMVAFLQSDDFKNARTDADLSNRWFEFEEIDFARDSAAELDTRANAHIRNIAAIMKAFPTAKIKIGGNADKSGNRIYNPGISEQRAERIKALLVEQGIAPERISTQGFGDEFAVWPAGASELQSSSDRDIAFRFTL